MRRKVNPNFKVFGIKRPVKKQTLSALKKKADKLLQLKYVPLNPICLVCEGQTSEMHHFIYKSQSNYLRYNPLNLIPLCRRCHSRHHLSGDPSIVATILERKGMEWYKNLNSLKHKICKLNRQYLQDLINDLN